MKSTKTAKFLILYTIYLIVAIAVYASFYLYIDNKEVAAKETAVEIKQLQEQNNQMHNLVAMVRDTEEGGERINSFFVDSDKIIEFLETIEGLGETAGVEIDVKSINEDKTETEKIKELNLNISFLGPWSEAHHFLVLLESMPIKVVPERLSIREVEKEDEGTEWSGNIFFKTLELEK